jgi:hypothetical protein
MSASEYPVSFRKFSLAVRIWPSSPNSITACPRSMAAALPRISASCRRSSVMSYAVSRNSVGSLAGLGTGPQLKRSHRCRPPLSTIALTCSTNRPARASSSMPSTICDGSRHSCSNRLPMISFIGLSVVSRNRSLILVMTPFLALRTAINRSRTSRFKHA